MTKLSVNINKVATLRNARGGDIPNVVQVAKDVQNFGGQGITVHPRPDERHIRYQDVLELRPVVYTEFNIEGNPVKKFIDLVLQAKPEQVTLVPDAEDAITSNAGWDVPRNMSFLQEVIAELKARTIRTSIFVDPEPRMVEAAVRTGTDRIELYTESYAAGYAKGNHTVVEKYVRAAEVAVKEGLGINAGHDLSLENIGFFVQKVPEVAEVSIGHALIAEALYEGLETVIHKYLKLLEKR